MLNPTRWRIWSAIAVLRWLQRRAGRAGRRPPVPHRAVAELRGFGDQRCRHPRRPPGADPQRSGPGDGRLGAAIVRHRPDHRRQAQRRCPERVARRTRRSLHAGARSDAGPEQCALRAHHRRPGRCAQSADRNRGPFGTLDSRPGRRAVPSWQRQPEGALGLAGLFLGPITASGLAAAFRAFTGFPVRVEEFAGAEVLTARPSRVGLPTGMMLGSVCCLPSAGIEVHIEGAPTRAPGNGRGTRSVAAPCTFWPCPTSARRRRPHVSFCGWFRITPRPRR